MKKSHKYTVSEIIEDAIRKIEERRTVDNQFAGSVGLEQVFDIYHLDYCFLFMNDEKNGPKLEIPWAFVTHVKILAASEDEG